MNKMLALVFFAGFLFHGHGQESLKVNWLYEDLSQYTTYTISDFTINDSKIDYRKTPNASHFLELFKQNMEKVGLDYDSTSVLGVKFKIHVDTLDAGYQRIDGIKYEDRQVDFTLTLVDQEVHEKLLVANINTFAKGPKKIEKELKRILKAFFREVRLHEDD